MTDLRIRAVPALLQKAIDLWIAPVEPRPRDNAIGGDRFTRISQVTWTLMTPAPDFDDEPLAWGGRGNSIVQYATGEAKEPPLRPTFDRRINAFRHNAVRLQLHALAYNLANFMRTFALPEEVEHWSLTTLREKLVKIGARIVHHGRYVVFQLAEVAVPRALFLEILRRIERLRPRPPPFSA
jgi:hypothetical protein